jgi:hypothetical protein
MQQERKRALALAGKRLELYLQLLEPPVETVPDISPA